MQSLLSISTMILRLFPSKFDTNAKYSVIPENSLQDFSIKAQKFISGYFGDLKNGERRKTKIR